MRCNKCTNCIKLESEKRLALMAVQPYHLVRGRLQVNTNPPDFDNEAWNKTLASLPCYLAPMDHTHTSKLLEQMSLGWITVNINRKAYRGYLSRDYNLDGWMLGFPSMNNYCFDVEQVIEIEAPNLGRPWSITLKDDERFGK